ncbi:hypothetical protein Q3G72_011821 [Acer saccharum]|nr:hypothetical protein Q3G72_011821 [Acer saccharum]
MLCYLQNAKHARWLPLLVYSIIYMFIRPSPTRLRRRVPPLLSTKPRPEGYLTDPKLLAALQENRKRQAPYCGAFLLKDEPGSDTSATETEKTKPYFSGWVVQSSKLFVAQWPHWVEKLNKLGYLVHKWKTEKLDKEGISSSI